MGKQNVCFCIMVWSIFSHHSTVSEFLHSHIDLYSMLEHRGLNVNVSYQTPFPSCLSPCGAWWCCLLISSDFPVLETQHTHTHTQHFRSILSTPSPTWVFPDAAPVDLPADSVWTVPSVRGQVTRLWTPARPHSQWFPPLSPSPGERWAASVLGSSSQSRGHR